MDEQRETTEVGGEDAAHFCIPPTLEEVEQWKAYWRKDWEETHPRKPAPPMGNLSLALELAGDGIRSFEFQGQTYHLKPTPYSGALRLLQVQELMKLLEAIGTLTGLEEFVALKNCYATIADVGGQLLVPPLTINPFLVEAGEMDLAGLMNFLIDPGNEMPLRDSDGDGDPVRYNAAYHLMAYTKAFGPPTTWRKFCAGNACLVRLDAEEALRFYGAVYTVVKSMWGEDDARKAWVAEISRESGQ
jgi:hypothetical protein